MSTAPSGAGKLFKGRTPAETGLSFREMAERRGSARGGRAVTVGGDDVSHHRSARRRVQKTRRCTAASKGAAAATPPAAVRPNRSQSASMRSPSSGRAIPLVKKGKPQKVPFLEALLRKTAEQAFKGDAAAQGPHQAD